MANIPLRCIVREPLRLTMKDAATLSGLPQTALRDAVAVGHLEARRIAGHVLIGYASLKRFLGIPDDVVLDWTGDARVLRLVPRPVTLCTDVPPNERVPIPDDGDPGAGETP
jgi:hypothetical protein